VTQSELEDAVMAYLAKDDGDNPSFQSLTTIFELLPEASQLTEAQYDDDEIEDKEELRAALDQLVADGMVESRAGERDYEKSYRISQDGFYQAVLGPEALVSVAGEASSEPISSTAWTGSGLIYVDRAVLEEIRRTARKLQVASSQVNYQSIEDKDDITGLTEALVGLCNMAQPDVTIIDQITSHPKFKHYTALLVLIATIRGAFGI
jgi:hypothetical protein